MSPVKVLEKPSQLSQIALGIQVFLILLSRAILSPFYGSSGGKTYRRDIIYTAVRRATSLQTLEQHRHNSVSTTATYEKVCSELGRTPETLVLPSGLKAHWLGRPRTEKIIIWYHGNGYAVGLNDGAMKYYCSLIQDLNKGSDRLCMLIPAHDLAPEAQYPTQLGQGVEVLSHMIEKEGYKPSQIIIAGDSAGGNLALAVLSHIMHPHPSLPELNLSEPLSAVILISPWVSFSTDWSSFKRNANADVLEADSLNMFSKAFLGDVKKTDAYMEPLKADRAWWVGLERVVPSILLWGGEAEVMIDCIAAFAEKLEQAYRGKLTFWVEGHAIHDEMIIDAMAGFKEKGMGARLLENWIRSRL